MINNSRSPPMVMDIRRPFVSAQFTGRALLEDGSLAYFVNGLIHRDDGAAREFRDGTLMHYAHGLLHNDRGPAVLHADGRTEYWHRGRPCHAAEPSVMAKEFAACREPLPAQSKCAHAGASPGHCPECEAWEEAYDEGEGKPTREPEQRPRPPLLASKPEI